MKLLYSVFNLYVARSFIVTLDFFTFTSCIHQTEILKLYQYNYYKVKSHASILKNLLYIILLTRNK
jgi:hypothetical protein